jgi:lipid-A-disaccharide synthase
LNPPRLLVAAAEPSADAIGAAVVDALRSRGRLPGLQVRGMGGPALQRAGLVPEVPVEGTTAVGLLDGLKAARRGLRVVEGLASAAASWRPHLVLTLDAPSLTLRLGHRARRLGVPVVHVGAPQVWAWRPGRRRRLSDSVDELLCLLPFEPEWFAGHVLATFVGHPAAELPPAPADPRFTVALLPGSRRAEVRRLAPVMRDVARLLWRRRPDVGFVTTAPPGAAGLTGVAARRVGDVAAVGSATVALAASGTLTLQLASMGVPQVVIYRTDALSWAIGRRVVTVPHVALPNLVAGAEVVPERLQHLVASDLVDLLMEQADRPRTPLTVGPTGAVQRMAERVECWMTAAGIG